MLEESQLREVRGPNWLHGRWLGGGGWNQRCTLSTCQLDVRLSMEACVGQDRLSEFDLLQKFLGQRPELTSMAEAVL